MKISQALLIFTEKREVDNMPNEKKFQELQWLLCPKCGKKTRLKLRDDTELKNFPLYCPKCKQMTLVDVKNFSILNQTDLIDPQYFSNGRKKNSPQKSETENLNSGN